MAKRVSALLVLCCAVTVLSGCYFLARRHARVREADARAAQTAARAAAEAKEAAIILDSEGDNVETKGDWPPGLGGGDWKDSCLFAFQGKGECTFIWRPNLAKCGRYRVSVWFGGDPNSDHATNSPFTVHFCGGQEKHEIDQTRNSEGWRVLGVYPFTADRAGYVELSNNANGNVVADAVKFEFVGPCTE